MYWTNKLKLSSCCNKVNIISWCLLLTIISVLIGFFMIHQGSMLISQTQVPCQVLPINVNNTTCQDDKGSLNIIIDNHKQIIQCPPTELNCESICCQQEAEDHKLLYCWVDREYRHPPKISSIYDTSQIHHNKALLIAGIVVSVVSILLIIIICICGTKYLPSRNNDKTLYTQLP